MVGDLNKRIQNQGKMHKQDNEDIWTAFNFLIREGAERGAIKVTWAKGHATQEHTTSGKTNHEELARNKAVGKLATEGIAMNKIDGIMVKAARQRKTIAALQQTMLVKFLLNQQELMAWDRQEQQLLDEEAEAIAEMEGEFKEQQQPRKQLAKAELEDTESSAAQKGRKSWQYIKIRVPAYKWETSEGNQFFRDESGHNANQPLGRATELAV